MRWSVCNVHTRLRHRRARDTVVPSYFCPLELHFASILWDARAKHYCVESFEEAFPHRILLLRSHILPGQHDDRALSILPKGICCQLSNEDDRGAPNWGQKSTFYEKLDIHEMADGCSTTLARCCPIIIWVTHISDSVFFCVCVSRHVCIRNGIPISFSTMYNIS